MRQGQCINNSHLRSGRSRRIEHNGNDGGVVGPEVVPVPAGDGAVHEALGRVDPLPLIIRTQHVLLVGLLCVANNSNGLKVRLRTRLTIRYGTIEP